MDTNLIAALSIAVSALIVAIGGQIVNIITAWKTDSKTEKMIENVAKVAEVTNVIEKNTNSRADRQDKMIGDLLAEVKHLNSVISAQDKAVANTKSPLSL